LRGDVNGNNIEARLLHTLGMFINGTK